MNIEKIKSMLKEKWNIQGFIATPLYLCINADTGLKMDFLGVSYRSFIYYYKEDYVEMYYNIPDLEKIWATVYGKYKKDKKYLRSIRDEYRRQFNTHTKFLKTIKYKEISKDTNSEFFKNFHKIINAQWDSVGISHMIESFGMLNDTKLRNHMLSCGLNEKKANKYTEILSQPVNTSWATQCNINLLEISMNDLYNEQLLEKHTEKYHWVENNYLSGKPLSVEDFKSRIDKTEIKLPDYESIRESKKEIIKEMKLNDEIIELINLIEFFAEFQDERKKNILSTMFYLEIFVEELSRRYNIKSNLCKYLLYNEINEDFLSKPDILDILKTRRKGCVIVTTKDQINVLVGKDLENLSELISGKTIKDLEELHGLPASRGTAIGRARICKSYEAIKNVEEGDILIAPMTRPEFVPGMKKASGIVTDEGGITCHAAIISRELGKPCVIGTQIATKVINDGDLIEVKGNHGLVVILEKKIEKI